MKKLLIGIFVFLLWLGIWQCCYLIVGRDVILVSPQMVAGNILRLLQSADLYYSIVHTLRNVAAGFAIAMLVGIFLAVITYVSSPLRVFFIPVIAIMKATPVASFIILALFFMNSKNLPILVSFLMVMPLFWRNIFEGMHSVDGNLREMSKLFGVPFSTQLLRIYLPAAIPYFVAAFQTGFGYAWKSAITAEVMSSPKLTIGRHLADSKVYLDTLTLFSWTIIAIILSIMTEKLLNKLIAWIIKRYFPPLEGGNIYDKMCEPM